MPLAEKDSDFLKRRSNKTTHILLLYYPPVVLYPQFSETVFSSWLRPNAPLYRYEDCSEIGHQQKRSALTSTVVLLELVGAIPALVAARVQDMRTQDSTAFCTTVGAGVWQATLTSH